MNLCTCDAQLLPHDRMERVCPPPPPPAEEEKE